MATQKITDQFVDANKLVSITPPPELVRQWWEDPCSFEDSIKQAARWGSDQELEACCSWLLLEGWHPSHPNKLRAARRPQAPPETVEIDGHTYRLVK